MTVRDELMCEKSKVISAHRIDLIYCVCSTIVALSCACLSLSLSICLSDSSPSPRPPFSLHSNGGHSRCVALSSPCLRLLCRP